METNSHKSSQHRSVLIGSSGTGNAFASILALRRNWGTSIKIVSMDINPKHLITSSLLSDKYYKVPPTANPEFKNSVVDIISNENISTYIPFIDDEILVAASLYEQKQFTEDLNLQVKSSSIADLCNDKYKTFLWLSDLNILTPECYKIGSDIKNKLRLILKPRRGFGSQVLRISEVKDLCSRYNAEDYIIQQECDNIEITIDVCYDKSRNYFNYVCRERIETKSGVCTKARLFLDKHLESVALKIADKLNLHSFCFQVMKFKGEWAVTDINARLGAGTGMSMTVGMDFFSAMFAILWGENPSEYFRPLEKETYVTRQYNDFIMNM